MRTNTEYKNAALAALKGNWAPAVLLSVLLFIITGALMTPQYAVNITNPAATPLILGLFCGFTVASIFLIYPLTYIGYYNSCRFLYENGDDQMISNCFKLTFNNYWHNVWVCLLMMIKIFLWALLFLIPGIYKALCYSMAPYIAIDHPELSAKETIAMSRQMTKGHVWDLLWLGLSFIGWIILGFFTLGIGYFWLYPYMYTTFAAFYGDLKAEYLVGNSEA
jgi:uncharacterized membrane protein